MADTLPAAAKQSSVRGGIDRGCAVSSVFSGARRRTKARSQMTPKALDCCRNYSFRVCSRLRDAHRKLRCSQQSKAFGVIAARKTRKKKNPPPSRRRSACGTRRRCAPSHRSPKGFHMSSRGRNPRAGTLYDANPARGSTPCGVVAFLLNRSHGFHPWLPMSGPCGAVAAPAEREGGLSRRIWIDHAVVETPTARSPCGIIS